MRKYNKGIFAVFYV